jgi:hypothetical protein
LSAVARRTGLVRQCAVAAWLPCTAHLARLKALSGQRAARPDSTPRAAQSTASPRPPAHRPPPHPSCRVPTVASRRSPARQRTPHAAPRPDRCLARAARVASDIVARRCRALAIAVSAPVRRRPRRRPCTGAEPPPSARRRAEPPRARGPRTRCACGPSRRRGVGHVHCASGPSANSAQCTRLILLISDLFNSLQIQKFV